jgi:hypothetical protein
MGETVTCGEIVNGGGLCPTEKETIIARKRGGSLRTLSMDITHRSMYRYTSEPLSVSVLQSSCIWLDLLLSLLLVLLAQAFIAQISPSFIQSSVRAN